MKNFKDYIKEKVTLVDRYLEESLPRGKAYPSVVHQAMRYSVFAGGKRLRPLLCIAAFETFKGPGERDLSLTCCALEMLHTFSLIHDDLPCMDDDDFRRGMPTLHKKFGEANAVLAGDALCIYAFELLGRTETGGLVEETARALGTQGMIGGQVVDIESEGKSISKKTLEYIHDHKTGEFITTSLRLGALIARASGEELELITRFGKKIGLSFQIVDDILDEISTTDVLGKDAGSDKSRGKATYPALYGIDESRNMTRRITLEAKEILGSLDRDTLILENFADYIAERGH